MSIIDTIMGMLGKKTPKTGNSVMDSLLPQLLKGGSLGSLTGLVEKFKAAGLGDKVTSWLGNGKNAELHPDEVTKALGADTVTKIATDAGVSNEQAQTGLAAIIPNLVSHLSPNGSLPTASITKMLKGVDFSKILSGFSG